MQINTINHGLCILSLTLLTLLPNSVDMSGKTNLTLQKQHRVATGNWGGQNIRLDVTESGAEIQFNCAHGDIEGSLVLDQEGRFSVKGTYVRQSMGPLREGNSPEGQPAVYSGVIHDQSMTLTVTLKETNQNVGTFTLEHGKLVRLVKCH